MRRVVLGGLCVLVAVTVCPALHAFDQDGDGIPDADIGRADSVVYVGAEAVAKLPADGTVLTVSWDPANSEVGWIDLDTGAWTLIGYCGWPWLNSLAVSAAGVHYSVSMTGTDGDSTLVTIDAITGVATPVAPLSAGMDIRALAFSLGGALYAVRDPDGGNVDELHTIDVATGLETYVGALTGFTGIQGLAFSPTSGALYAWDIFQGLLLVEPATAVTTDVNPAIPGTFDIQAISVLPNGTIIGGRYDLYSISSATGDYVEIAAGGYPDVRGMEFMAVAGLIFADGFESGDMTAWSSTTPGP